MVATSALAVIVAGDIALSKLAAPKQLREVEDGVADLERGNPDTLVLGSSHARTLHVLGGELAKRTGGAQTLVSVPLENGKWIPYQWTLEHRLKPLVEERGADGQPKRPRIKRFVLITEWWDSCSYDGGVYWNLPSRAWAARDFLADVADNGITGYNRNYLQNRLRRTFRYSSLMYDRTQQVLVPRISDVLHRRPIAPVQQNVAGWRRTVERGVDCIGAPEQMQAFRKIADYAASRGWEMTIILWPRKPVTLSEQARATTLPAFAKLIRDFAEPRHIRVVDLTTTSPIGDDDYMEDFDHFNAGGNAKFAPWALDHELSFLASAPPDGSAALAAAHE